jgi:hypothetical protein
MAKTILLLSVSYQLSVPINRSRAQCAKRRGGGRGGTPPLPAQNQGGGQGGASINCKLARSGNKCGMPNWKKGGPRVYLSMASHDAVTTQASSLPVLLDVGPRGLSLPRGNFLGQGAQRLPCFKAFERIVPLLPAHCVLIRRTISPILKYCSFFR